MHDISFALLPGSLFIVLGVWTVILVTRDILAIDRIIRKALNR